MTMSEGGEVQVKLKLVRRVLAIRSVEALGGEAVRGDGRCWKVLKVSGRDREL